MNNYTLPELILAIAVLIWPICLLILAIIFKKDISKLLSVKYCKKIHTSSEGTAQIGKSDSVNLSNVAIKTKTDPQAEKQENLHIEDDLIYVEVCKNLKSEKIFIVIDEANDDKATMIIPNGEVKELELNLFSEVEGIELKELSNNKLITEQQLRSFENYIDDDATKSIEEYQSSRKKPSTSEPPYVKVYRAMLGNPDTEPSRMLNYIKEIKVTTQVEIKRILSNKYGYRNSGSFSASLRVLFIDGYIDINGKGDDKTISFITDKI